MEQQEQREQREQDWPISAIDFEDAGLRGLYGGLTAADLAQRKGLTPYQDLYDHMNSEELRANNERIALALRLIRRWFERHPQPQRDAARCCRLHELAGHLVRRQLQRAGARLPEAQPAPVVSAAQLAFEHTLATDPAARAVLN